MPTDQSSIDTIGDIANALTKELARREALRDAEEEARWREEHGDDAVKFFSLWLNRYNQRLAKKASEPTPQWYLALSDDERELLHRQAEEKDRLIDSCIEVANRLERHREDVAAGIVRRPRRVAGGPRSPHLLDREPKSGSAQNGDSASKKMSRSEKWKAEQEAQAAARQQMMPQRAALQQTELGWHRGVVLDFDQTRKTGVVKFAGMAAITEAELTPDAAMRSGHANFFPSEKVDCRLIRRLDGSVFIQDVKMASGANPESTEQFAADAERYKMHLSRNKWMH
jgi:hypothetical protein